MNGNEVLRIVDTIHRDKNIDKEIVFDGIEQSIISAARKFFGEEADVHVRIDRDTGEPNVKVDEETLDTNEIGELLGRIAAQTAKQVMIQKIREAERDALFEEYSALKSQIVTGTISRMDGGTGTVNLGKVEGILPRGEQIPGEAHRVGERVRAIVMEVRKAGSRVKIILSRTHPDLVRRLFELEIPEVAEHVIEVRSIAREAGYRSKVAVSCYDNKVDAVGACVGVRGSRIKTIVDELAGERIDIVRWNDSLQVLVPNALQPAEVEDVILCPMLGKVIVLVMEDQLSLAIGKKGQNVRLASKLVGWDVNLMTQEKLDEQIDASVETFSHAPHMTDELAEDLIAQGFFSFEDLSIIEPEQLAELGGLTVEQVEEIIAHADVESDRIFEHKQREREADRLRRRMGIEEPKPAPVAETAAAEAATDEAATGETATDAEASDADAADVEKVTDEVVADEAVQADLGAGAGLTEESIEAAAEATETTTDEPRSPDEVAAEDMATAALEEATATEPLADDVEEETPAVEAAGLPESATPVIDDSTTADPETSDDDTRALDSDVEQPTADDVVAEDDTADVAAAEVDVDEEADSRPAVGVRGNGAEPAGGASAHAMLDGDSSEDDAPPEDDEDGGRAAARAAATASED